MRLLVVLGSVTPPGRLRRALEDAIARAEQDWDADIELIDLANRELAFADGSDPGELDDDSAEVIASVTAADAVLFATPVYRGSMTGADFHDGAPGERAAFALDELLAGTDSLAATLADGAQLGPSPLAARAIRR